MKQPLHPLLTGLRTALLLLAAPLATAQVAAAPTTSAPLADLIQAGARDEALARIRAGADVQAAQPDGSTPLLWAVYRVDAELVRALLQKGADPSAQNDFGSGPLAEAAKLGNVELAGLLLKAKARVEAANTDGQTPLMLAVNAGSLPVAELLIRHRADVNAREQWRGQTPLMWAAGAGRDDLVRLLIRHGARVNERAAAFDWSGSGGAQVTSEPRAQYKPTGGLTPLLYAARSGCLACIEPLLAAGADVDLPTPDGVTPLMIALDNVNYDVARLLLAKGANARLSDWWGRTALYVAVDSKTLDTRTSAGGGSFAAYGGTPDPDEKTTAVEMVRLLLAAGADVDPQLNFHRPGRGGNSGRFVDPLLTTGATPLLRAATARDAEVVGILLDAGADVALPNVFGVTPLMAASGVGSYNTGVGTRETFIDGVDLPTRAIATIDRLLAAGADIDARIEDPPNRTSRMPRPGPMNSRDGQTPLHGAVLLGHVAVIEHLIAKGARADTKDGAGKGLVEIAQNAGGGRDPKRIAEIVALLKAAGAGGPG